MPGKPNSRTWRVAGLAAIAAVGGWWLLLAIRQVADGGFYSDDWGVMWYWHEEGYWGATETQLDLLGAKPLLAFALNAPYEAFGEDPTGHHVLAAALVLATAAIFYLVLRKLRFEARDAVPIALLALMFPWATGVRLWPTGSVNNLAVLLLFAGLLVALRGLNVRGRRGLLVHLGAAALYAASVLSYDAVTFVACMLWPAYVWLAGWRAALPRAGMDVAAVGAAALYTAENTNKHIADLSDQLAHVPEIAREGADLIAASLVPASVPAELPSGLTVAVIAAALAVLAAAALRGRWGGGVGSPSGSRWPLVAAVALGALALSWVVYVPQAFYTPTFRGLEDRVNVIALYPAAVLVWAVLRSAGGLVARDGYPLAVAGAVAVLIGYGIHDTRQQSDWAEAAERQEEVLAAIGRAAPPDHALVLTFGHSGQTAPRVPVFNQSWDLHPAAMLRIERPMHAYPAFKGAELRCAPKGVAVDRLPTPLYWTIDITGRGTPGVSPYGLVTFVDVEGARSELIRSREQCEEALDRFPPASWIDDSR